MGTNLRIAEQADDEWLPQGSIAPEGAWYVELDDHGEPTGIWASVGEGDRLPVFGLRDHIWRIASLTD
jgi:hypothetical protein